MAATPTLAQLCRAAPIAFYLLLGACDDKDPAKQPNDALAKIDKETALMADPERAATELEQRLAANISASDGFVSISQNTIVNYTFPTNTPWIIQCGYGGFSITFGSSISGTGGDVSNDVQVFLTSGEIDLKTCPMLGKRIGKRLQEMLGQDQEH